MPGHSTELAPEMEASSRLDNMAERVVTSQVTGRVPAASFSGIFPEIYDDSSHLRGGWEKSSGAWTTGLFLDLECREL